MVRRELVILLGQDDLASLMFVKDCENQMAAEYKTNMAIIRELEMVYYGQNSYYRLVEPGRYRAPRFEGDYVTDDEAEE